MIDIFVGFSIAVLLTWCMTPRLFRFLDVVEMQRRLHGSHPISENVQSPSSLPTLQRKDKSQVVDFASLCDSLARATRSGAAPHDAVLASLQRTTD